MHYRNLQLHNVAELADMGDGTLRPQRYPEAVCAHLSEGGQERALEPANVEMRWVCDSGPGPGITLSSEGQTSVVSFAGPYDLRQRWTLGAEPVTLRPEPYEQLERLPPSARPVRRFPPRVFRLVFWGAPIRVHGVEGAGFRPPAPDELPQRSYLAYGTSITHGSAASAPNLNYASQAAWHLCADLINLGLGGSALCEPEVADYIAGRDDWDFATLALSVNMVGHGFTVDAFRERVQYMVETVAGGRPSRPVFCITLWPYYLDFGVPQPAARAAPDAFRAALREAVAAAALPNLSLLEGPELLTDTDGLSADLIHPADNAMVEMGRRLAQRMEPRLTP